MLCTKKCLYFFLLVFVLAALGCSTVPITGRRQLELVPSDQLMAMSADQYSDFMSKHEVVTGTPDARMVAQVGNRISQAVERYFREQNKSGMLQGYQWEFNLIKDSSANAWAMAGGKVAVYTGTLSVAQGENGLATIMGHEIAHAVAQHGNERMSQGLLNQLGGMALATALSQQPETTKGLFMTAYGAGTQVGILLPYSRLHETEADQMGLIFMAMAGYDPKKAVDFWLRMEKKSQKGSPPGIFKHASCTRNKNRKDKRVSAKSHDILYTQGVNAMKKKHCVQSGSQTEQGCLIAGHHTRPEVLKELFRLAGNHGSRHGMNRRAFIKSQMGLAASFLALNSVFGPFFSVSEAEAVDPETARSSIEKYAHQFIFDVQVHYVREKFPTPEGLLSLRQAADGWHFGTHPDGHDIQDIQFENFFREVFAQSQTKAAILSNAPNDDKDAWFLTNAQALNTRKKVNKRTGKRSLLAHAVMTPGQPGWVDDLDQALEMKPDAVKGYTLGDPGGTSKYPWRLDDEILVYPAYEKLQKAGIKNICIHKGLLPTDYKSRLPEKLSAHAGVDDVGAAARDWPDLNFIIYHSAIEHVIPQKNDADRFKKHGKINWVTDLSRIPDQYHVDNVYAELGAVFAGTCAAYPGLCAGILGTLIKNMGADHVCWGTDSVWFGSPQWQIEALRRFEIPEEMQSQYGFSPLGSADGKIKNMIFGENSAALYGIDPTTYGQDMT